ncbi:MAG: hypothetical protein KatS3mg113_1037 [Planctomycetaceae bacterium]|nr:MAG: hypothetical protein KatS3mg113_1037 [Planctomycetaceae bacterium]
MPTLTDHSCTEIREDELLARCLGRRDLAVRVLQQFRKQLMLDLPRIYAALAAEDYAYVGLAAHRIKGAAANVTACELQQLASQIEDAARQNQLVEVQTLVAQFSDALHRFKAVVDALLQGKLAENLTPSDSPMVPG